MDMNDLKHAIKLSFETTSNLLRKAGMNSAASENDKALAETMDIVDRRALTPELNPCPEEGCPRDGSAHAGCPCEPRTCETYAIDGAPFTYEKSVGNYCSEIYDKDGIEYATFEPGEIGDRKAWLICNLLNKTVPRSPQPADVETVRKAIQGMIDRARPYVNESGVIEISLGDFCRVSQSLNALDRLAGKEK